MKKPLILLLVFLAFLPQMLMAQAATANAPTAKSPAILLAYSDNGQVSVTDANKKTRVVSDGDYLKAGDTIITEKGNTAELQIQPNGSIIKLAGGTTFVINSLKSDADPKSTNDLTIAAGKLRAVAAKLAGANNSPGYTLKTPTANCGVRGTDFAVMVDATTKKEWLCVQEGLVDFTKDATGEKVAVAAGQFADALADTFASTTLDQAKLDELFSDVGFVKLDPAVVKAIKVASTNDQAATDAGDVNSDKTKTNGTGTTPPPAPKKDDPLMAWLKKILGMEIGSVTIGNTTYSKAVLSPVISLDGFRLGLYLPIVYTSDMFDPSTWYHPAGNDEWSFGQDKTDLIEKAEDILSDLVLKIKFLELGRQGVDPFYLKLGNLSTMTIGHGSIMNNFANDQEFPAVRKIGLNAGVQFGPIGLEGVVDDASAPQVVGGRLYLNVIGDQVSVGLGAIADLALVDPMVLGNDPTLAGKTAADLGDPIFIVGGADLQLFKLDLGIIRAVAFADANALTAFYRDAYTANSTTVAQGLALKTLTTSYGAEAGIQGKVIIIDYRLAFQMEKGLYSNEIFRADYYRSRTDWLNKLNTYLTDPTSAATTDANYTVGVFGKAGFNLFNLLILDGSYRWPWTIKPDGSFDTSADDFLSLKLEIPKGALPDFIKLSGSISYERTKFAQALFNSVASGLTPFDANTVLKGEGVYGLVDGVDVVVGVSTIVQRDADGQIKYDSNGHQVITPSINLETRIAF